MGKVPSYFKSLQLALILSLATSVAGADAYFIFDTKDSGSNAPACLEGMKPHGMGAA